MHDIAAIVFRTPKDDLGAINTALNHSDIDEWYFFDKQRVFEEIPDYLASLKQRWIIHLDVMDRPLPVTITQDIAVEKLSPTALVSIQSQLFRNSVAGFRPIAAIWEQMMDYSVPSINWCFGIFDREYMRQIWTWASRRNLIEQYPDNYLDAMELFVWLSTMTRGGYIYGVPESFVVPAVAPCANLALLAEFRYLFVQHWVGLKML